MTTRFLIVFFSVLAISFLGVGLFQRPHVSAASVLAPSDLPLRGWLWAENFGGWISFCGGEGTSDCPGNVPYQVIVNNDTGEFRGTGWISNGSFYSPLSFDRDYTNNPPGNPFMTTALGSFIAQVDPLTGTGQMQGWGRILAACDRDMAGHCVSSDPGVNSGGWSGWLNFASGTAQDGTSYNGFVAAKQNGAGVLVGQAWGGEALGWVVAATSSAFAPPPQVPLPVIKVVLEADKINGPIPLLVTLTATITQSSSSLPITYHFDCAKDPASPNQQEFTLTTTTRTAIVQCKYDKVGSYDPLVDVAQNGVFDTAANISPLISTGGGPSPSITARPGIIREIPVDE